jgi:hypothetical protein
MERILLAIGATSFLTAFAVRAYVAFREHRTRRAVTDTAPCDGCGSTIRLNEKHVTVNRHIEYMDSGNSITVLDAETVATYHLRCTP